MQAVGTAYHHTKFSMSVGSVPSSSSKILRQSTISASDPQGGAGASKSADTDRLVSIERDSHPMMLAQFCTSVALSWITVLHPSDLGSKGELGMAMTSPPRSEASCAVISDPEREAASTTTTPSARPVIIRLRKGMHHAIGCVQGAFSQAAALFLRSSVIVLYFWRVVTVDTAGNHCDGTSCKRTIVRGCVNAMYRARVVDIGIVGKCAGQI